MKSIIVAIVLAVGGIAGLVMLTTTTYASNDLPNNSK